MPNDNINPNNDSGRNMLRIGSTLQGGKYRVVRYLASGGFGNTYLVENVNLQKTMVAKEFFLKGVTGRDVTDGRSVTITLEENKRMFASQLRKFEREARRLSTFNHSNIVRVHDLFDENGTSYYVMDYIEGESLGERVKRTGALSEQEVRLLLPQLVSALDEVHANGLFHLDLKPGNVMLDRNGVAHLIDFGTSKQMSADGTATTTTGLAYTPGYAAPEQVHGQFDRIGAWTDLYALGATAYHLLTSQLPPDAIDIDYNKADAFRFPPSVSPDMCEFVKWLMVPNYHLRPQSAAAVRERLDAMLALPAAPAAVPPPYEVPTIAAPAAPYVPQPAAPYAPQAAAPMPYDDDETVVTGPVNNEQQEQYEYDEPSGKSPVKKILMIVLPIVLGIGLITAAALYFINKSAREAEERIESSLAAVEEEEQSEESLIEEIMEGSKPEPVKEESKPELKADEQKKEEAKKEEAKKETPKPEPKNTPDKIYTSVEQMPSFPGGESGLMRFLNSHIRYPSAAAESGAQGRVIVQFVVNKDGSVGQAKVVRGVHPALDAEALRVVRTLPRFNPGRQGGQPVSVWYSLPVSFRLQG